MKKLQETLTSKRFQALAMAVLCAVGAYLTKAIDVAGMWEQIRMDLGLYITSIVAVQAPVEAMKALRGEPAAVTAGQISEALEKASRT